jgi:hypothetical protein
MIIPGFIIAWATFPGVIVHEFGHRLFCSLTNTPVRQVCYFRFGNPAGYVIHERPDSVWKHMLIGCGPLIVNSIVGFTLGAIVLLGLSGMEGTVFITSFLLWLAVSIAMHSFPSTGDAKSIWSALWDEDAPGLARLVGTPLVGLIYVGAIGSILWLDLAYGLGIAWFLPRQIVG